MCKAVTLFFKSSLLQLMQSLQFAFLTPLLIQEIDNLLFLLLNLSQIFTGWTKKADTGLKLPLLFLW